MDSGLSVPKIGQEPPFIALSSKPSNTWKFGAPIMSEILVLKISDHVHVELNGMKLVSINEVAEALQKNTADSPEVIISIETDNSKYYEAIGKAIYGSHRAGFSGERLRILVEGKLVED
jgi:biopolymer transport protein ExbD